MQEIKLYDITNSEEVVSLEFKVKGVTVVMDCETEYVNGSPTTRDVYFDIFQKTKPPKNPLYVLSWRYSDKRIEYHYDNLSEVHESKQID